MDKIRSSIKKKEGGGKRGQTYAFLLPSNTIRSICLQAGCKDPRSRNNCASYRIEHSSVELVKATRTKNLTEKH